MKKYQIGLAAAVLAGSFVNNANAATIKNSSGIRNLFVFCFVGIFQGKLCLLDVIVIDKGYKIFRKFFLLLVKKVRIFINNSIK